MSTTPPQLQFVARHKTGLDLYSLPSGVSNGTLEVLSKSNISMEGVKSSRFTPDGRYLAVSTSVNLSVYDAGTCANVCTIPVACADFTLSPTGKYMATYERPIADPSKQHFNLSVWSISPESNSFTKLTSYSHKTQATWMPQWTGDESHFCRMLASELHFYRADNLEKTCFKIQLDSIAAFAISPGPYPKVAVFTKEYKGQPGSVKIYLLPNTSSPMAQKMFFKADICSLFWSPSGKHLLALSQTDVDSTGISYYGETNLYFLSGDGSFDCRVDLDKEGPIHDVAWSPSTDEFIVLYGYMPPKTMLFDNKCNPVFEFPVGSKNHVRWNPKGSLILFGGFGNLQGQVEVWSRAGAVRRIGHFQSQGSTICEWGPDGSTILTAVLTPRLRVDNNFKIWSWNGSMLHYVPFNELYQVSWRHVERKAFGEVDTSTVPKTASGLLVTEGEVKKASYRPPGLRSAVKDTPVVTKIPAPVVPVKAAPSISAPSTLSKEEKAVKKLKDKVDQIQALKDRQSQGEVLELNQLDKITKEGEIRKEYEEALTCLDPNRK